MTENQLIPTQIQFGVNYVPSEITIEHEEELVVLVERVAEYYSSQVFSDENIADAKAARADLNKIIAQLESRRKEIKQEFTVPLSKFEEKMKSYVNRIQEVSSAINSSVKSFEETQKAIRLEKIQNEIKQIAKQYNVDPNSLEFSTSWLTKSSFTSKGEVKGKVLDEIKDKLKIIAMEQERIAADKATVADYAELAGLDPYAWTELVNQGWSVADIREKIKQAIDDKKIREAAAKEERQKREEYEAAMKELEKTQAVQNDTGQYIDRETGEIISIKEVGEQVLTVTLQLSGTQTQLAALNDYLIDHDITVVPVTR